MANETTNQPKYDKDGHWLRIMFAIMFYIIYKLADLVVAFIAVVQILFTVFGDEPNPKLKKFSGELSLYIQQILQFLGYASERKPYPFAEWPHIKEGKDA